MRDPERIGSAIQALAGAEDLAYLTAPEALLLAWSRDGSRLLWTSPAAARLGETLIGEGEAPGSALGGQLRAIGVGLRPDSGTRLDRLRFSANRLVPAVTCACRLLEVGDERVLLTVIMGKVPALAPGIGQIGRAAPAERDAGPPAAPSGISSAPPPPEDPEARLMLLQERGRQRFVWQADAQGRFTFVSDTLSDVVGPVGADILGKRWDEIAGLLVEDPDGEVSRLFERHETWSGRTVLWRIAGIDWAVPVDLAGIPAIGAEREVLGFRGFGVCRTDALTVIVPLPSAQPQPESGTGPDGSRDEPGVSPCDPDPPQAPPVHRPTHPSVDESAPGPSASSPPRTESGMDKAMPQAAIDPGFRTLSAKVGAKLGLPRPVPLRGIGAPEDSETAEQHRSRRLAAKTPQAETKEDDAPGGLSPSERNAFREIARALSMRPEPPAAEERRPSSPAPRERATRPRREVAGDIETAARLRELSAILDTVSDGIIVIDGTTRVLSLNRSAEALFGFDQDEVVGERLTKLFAPESQADVLDYCASVQRSGVGGVLNDGRALTGRVRQGGTLPLAMTIGRLGEAAAQRFCVVLRDVSAQSVMESDLVQAREAAARAGADKSDFLAKIGHEIRTPLNTVIGFAEIMLEERLGPIGSERYRDYLRDIRQAGRQVVLLIDGLFDLARIEAGRMELSFKGVRLNEIVEACVADCQGPAMRGRIVLRTSFGAGLPSVVADENSIRQIVRNLLANAVAFTRPGGQVIVSTALTEAGELAFRVRDTGIGMSHEEIEAALEPLRTLSAGRNGGLGLGLPLTKALVEANRGELQITSAPQQGTLVEVLFPATRVLAP